MMMMMKNASLLLLLPYYLRKLDFRNQPLFQLLKVLPYYENRNCLGGLFVQNHALVVRPLFCFLRKHGLPEPLQNLEIIPFLPLCTDDD